MKIVNALRNLAVLYPEGQFDPAAWRTYMDDLLPGIAEAAAADLRACTATGRFTWEKDFLPVLQGAWEHTAARQETEASFRAVTETLEARMAAAGMQPVDAGIVLYLGLCSGAGWVTQVQGRDAVLLGVEKIIELGWHGIQDMTGLILHELGHVYQAQHGILLRPELTGRQAFLWQLFTEGVAMVFEQRVQGDDDYFHQDRDGWREACQARLPQLAADFAADLDTMTFDTQRYFGDWVRWEGLGDTGYFLGARFVQHVCQERAFDSILAADVAQVEKWFADFLRAMK